MTAFWYGVVVVLAFGFGGIVGVCTGVYQERKRSRRDVQRRDFGGIN